MSKRKAPAHCGQDYHDSLKTSLVRFLASVEYIGVQESIPPNPPHAQGNCRRCGSTLGLPVTARQIVQLRGRASKRGYYRFPLSDEAEAAIVKLAGFQREDHRTHAKRPRFSYGEIARQLVESGLAKEEPDPATVRRVALASGVVR